MLCTQVPSGPPHDVRADAKSSTELYLTWNPPDRELWNGNILGYYVSYTEVADPATTSASNVATISNSVVASSPVVANVKTVDVGAQYGGETLLQGLSMYTNYVITVQSFNSRGAGPSSPPVTVRTLEGGVYNWKCFM